jgi:hypothetical protein
MSLLEDGLYEIFYKLVCRKFLSNKNKKTRV